MQSSTAFSVGIATMGVALAAGLSGGLLVANVINPKPPRQGLETAHLERSAPPDRMTATGAVPYIAASLAFIDPSIDAGRPATDREANRADAAPVQAAGKSSDQAAEPADAATAQPASSDSQATAAKPALGPDDAYAKAHDTDVKHTAERRRAQRWATRRRREQDGHDRQGRSDQYYQNYDGGLRYYDSYSDRRYGDNRQPRYPNTGGWYWGGGE
jgi:hypothetical protein